MSSLPSISPISFLKWFLRIFAGILLTVLLIIVSILGVLQTDWGADQVRVLVLEQVNQHVNGTVEIGQLDGSFISSLVVSDVQITQDGEPMASIDRASVNYSLRALLHSTIHVESASVSNPEFVLRQASDSTWNFTRFAPADTAADTTAGRWNVQIDAVEITEGSVEAHFYSPERDSVITSRDLLLLAHDLHIGPEISRGQLDQFNTEVTVFDEASIYQIGAAGRVTANEYVLDSLRIASDATHLFAELEYPRPEKTPEAQPVTGRLHADPILFEDLHPFFPSLPRDDSLYAVVKLDGTTQRMQLEADARISQTAQFTAAGTFTPPSKRPLVYEGTATLEHLNLARLTGDPGGITNMSGQLTIDLEGTSLEELSGTANMRLDEMVWAGQSMGPIRISSQWQQGQTEFQGQAQLVEGTIALDGAAAPFADVPTYSADTKFGNLHLSRFPGNLGAGELTGQLEVTGAGTNLDNLSTEAELILRNSTYETIYIQRARLVTDVQNRTVQIASDINLRGGSFSTEAQISPFHDPITYDLSKGRFSNVDLAALLNDTTMTTDLNGTLSMSGEGTSTDSLNLRGELELNRSAYEGYIIQDGALVANVVPAGITIEGALNSPGGALDFSGRAEPFADVPSLEQFTANFRDVDAGYIMQDTSYTTEIGGELTMSAVGAKPATSSLKAALSLDTFTLNNQTVSSANAALNLNNGVASIETLVDFPEGQLVLRGQAQPFEDTPTYTLDRLQFANVHLGQWLGRPDLTTSLTGTVELDGRGFDPETAVVDAAAQLESFQINSFTANQALLDLHWMEGTVAGNLNLDYSDGAVAAEVTGRPLQDPLELNAEGSIQNLPVTRIAGIDTLDSQLSVQFDMQTEETAPGETIIGGWVEIQDSYLGEVNIDSAFTAFTVLENGVQVDSLDMASNVIDIEGSGLVALPDSPRESVFDFSGNVENLSPLSSITGIDSVRGRGDINGRITGTADSMRFALETDLAGLTYSGYDAAYLKSQIEGTYADELIVDLDATFGAVALATTVIDRLDIDARYTEEAIMFANNVIIDRDREGHIAGRLEGLGDEPRLMIDSLAMRFDEQQWELLQPATLLYGEQYVVRDLTLDAGTQRIVVDGLIDPDGTHDMSLIFETVQIDQFTDLLGYEGVGGELDGTVTFTGPAASPSMDGQLALENFTSRQRLVGDLMLSLDYQDFQMGIELLLNYRAGRELTVRGTIPVNLSTSDPPQQQNLDLVATADSVAIHWVEPFVDPTVADDISGYLTVDMGMGGTFDAPELKGFFRLTDGHVGVAALGAEYTDIDLTIQFQNNVASIEQSSVHSGDGRLTVDGTINLPALNLGEFDLTVNADNFLAANTRTYRLAFDSNLRLEGTTERPVVRGNLTVTEGNFYLETGVGGADVEEVTLEQENIRQIEARFGMHVAEDDTSEYDPYEALVIDTLNVSVNRDVWLRSSASPEMAIELMGDLTIIKAAQEEMQAFGTIETVPARSYIEQFGRRFYLTTGMLTFNGPLENPILDIEAEYRLRGGTAQPDQAVLTLQLSGPLDDPSLELGSEEGLTTPEIVSYLILGRPPRQGAGGNTSVESVTTTAAIGQLTDLVEGLAMTELGLDVIEIEHDPQLGATLTAGAYLTQNLFASVSWPIALTNERVTDWTTQQVTLEYIISKWLILQLERESDVNSVDLIWEYAY